MTVRALGAWFLRQRAWQKVPRFFETRECLPPCRFGGRANDWQRGMLYT